MGDYAVTGSGLHYEPVSLEVLEQRLARADKPGQHLWVMISGHLVSDPLAVGQLMLDMETLLSFAGPCCYKCEEPFSGRLARRPCRGSVTR